MNYITLNYIAMCYITVHGTVTLYIIVTVIANFYGVTSGKTVHIPYLTVLYTKLLC